MKDAIKELANACKGQPDLLAFLITGVLAVVLATSTQSALLTLSFVFVMGVLWVGSRYALFRLQSQEQLRDIRHRSLESSQRMLEKHVSEDEFKLVMRSKTNKEDGDER